jgi:hypothetical protein
MYDFHVLKQIFIIMSPLHWSITRNTKLYIRKIYLNCSMLCLDSHIICIIYDTPKTDCWHTIHWCSTFTTALNWNYWLFYLLQYSPYTHVPYNLSRNASFLELWLSSSYVVSSVLWFANTSNLLSQPPVKICNLKLLWNCNSCHIFRFDYQPQPLVQFPHP